MARILLIDEDLATLKLTALQLTHAGHEVDEFADGMLRSRTRSAMPLT